MNVIVNIIVGLWFVPVTLFILIPLALLGGNLILTVVRQFTGKTQEAIELNGAVENN